MRITFVLPGQGLSGGVRVVASYAQLLQKRGHKVVVVSRVRVPSLRQRLRGVLRANRGSNNSSGPSHLDDLVGVEHRVVRTTGPIRDRDLPDADVVIATWWETAEWVACLRGTKGTKVYFVQHDEQVWFGPSCQTLQDRARATWDLPLRKIVVAQWLAALARERHPGETVWCVPNGVNLSMFCRQERVKGIVPTVGFMYSEPAFKGTDIALKAVSEMRRSVPDIRVVAFGMYQPTEKLPLPVNCDYSQCPRQKEIPLLYGQCDAWLVLSRSEGFGLPILEAMACGTPVIATPAGAAPELLDGGGGQLVAMDDAKAAATAGLQLIRAGPKEWNDISAKARRTAEQYNDQQAAIEFENALAQIIGSDARIESDHTCGRR